MQTLLRRCGRAGRTARRFALELAINVSGFVLGIPEAFQISKLTPKLFVTFNTNQRYNG
jgi:hypothetical protein